MSKAKQFLRTNQEFNELAQDFEIIAQLCNLQEEGKVLLFLIMPVVIDVTKSSGYQKGKLESKLKITNQCWLTICLWLKL